MGFAMRSGLHGIAVFIDGLEVAAIEADVVLVFAREHRVGLCAGRDQNAARGQRHRLPGRHKLSGLGVEPQL